MIFIQGELKHRSTWCTRAQLSLMGILIAFLLCAQFFWIRPFNRALDSANARAALAQNELTDDQQRAKNLPSVEREIARLRKRVERFDKVLPKQQDLAQFMSEVTRISQDASLRKLSWHLDSKPRKSDQFTELPIQFTFEGDFQSGVLQFLQGTEDMPRLTRVRKLNLKASDAHDGQVRAEITMNIYFGDE